VVTRAWPAIAGLAGLPRLARIVLGATMVVGGCAGAPWFLGQPLDDRVVVPATTRAQTVADHRRTMEKARRRGFKVIEIAELTALEQRGALRAEDEVRFAELLKERAREWSLLGRPIALAADLRHIIALQPQRVRSLTRAMRAAERAAGDLWLALGENARAEEAYHRAERQGADRMVFRLRAAWGASPADLDQSVLAHAIEELPERSLGPFAVAYLAGGGSQPRLLYRAWSAARVYGPPELLARIESIPAAATFVVEPSPSSLRDRSGSESSERLAAPKVPAATIVEPASDDQLLTGATLAHVLLPLCDAFPDLTAPSPRSRGWADRLIAEDPTSADSLEIAALIDARAGRLGGAARKLGELVFYSPDRALGYARAARVWERAGQDRRACRAWEQAAHFGAVDDPRWCDLLACVRRDPVVGDARAIVDYVRNRAPRLTCVVPTSVDGGAGASDGGGRDSNGIGATEGPDGGLPEGGVPESGPGNQSRHPSD
jgi:hypothetical protein